MQWLACRHFSGDLPSFVLPFRLEDLPRGRPGFDTVFTMGVLYHRRDPLQHLKLIRELLGEGGTLVVETLVLPRGREDDVLVPEGRYARMRNVWSVPGTDRLTSWVKEAGFRRARVVDISTTSAEEQRTTDWMRFESLEAGLDAADPSRTVEGYTAPVRAVVMATR